MPDPYLDIASAPVETQELLSNVLMVRAEEAEMRDIRRRYFAWLDAPEGGRGIEIGCGTGDVVMDLLERTALAEAVGLDPSPVLLSHATRRFAETPGLTFTTGDARALPSADESFDLALFHTSLCHIPQPEQALAEAFRILRPGGAVCVFDGDYAAATAALGPDDPLQACIDHAIRNLVHNAWLCRQLPQLLRAASFEIVRRDAHPYLANGEAPYFMTVVDRGADFMMRDGLIGREESAALKAEARSRLAKGAFFGFIPFHSVIARKPRP